MSASFGKFARLGMKLLALCLAAHLSWAQTQQNQTPADHKQDIPDAPSAVRPPQPFPVTQPPPNAPEPQPNAAPPEARPSQPPTSTAPGNAPPSAPPFNVTTVPPGSVKPPGDSSQEQLYKMVIETNQVVIPVRVTDDSGHLVEDLRSSDFAVYENGKKQKLTFFTSSPFALSAAVILDLGMPDAAVQKVNRTFSALEGAFSDYDEIGLYTYSSTVSKVTDFGGVGKRLDAALGQLKYVTGTNNGPPILGGPMGPQGPVINGIPLDPQTPRVMTPPQESHVLNDAILAAAVDLSRRDKARRRIIFVIGDGRELHSMASYSDVLKVLLTNGITVYAIGVGSAALPGYGKLARIHLPRMGYTDILPRYANATAGEYLTDNSRDAIETAYSRAVGEARNEYTLGYMAPHGAGPAYRQIEVTVARPDVKVYAKDGYYPAAPGR